MPDWVPKAREILFRAGLSDRGWGYRLGAKPAVEPTVLVCLALSASDPRPPEARTVNTVRGACEWLAKLQQASGAIGVTPDVPQIDWATSYAMLLWATQPGFDAQRKKAVERLLKLEGTAYPRSKDDIVGHNTELVGWPWVVNTHSWLEPTAMAVLALRRESQAEHPRVREGLKVIRDRAIPTGGWNYGNTSALGNTLRAQPGPTGQALVALAGVEGEGPIVDNAAEYLVGELPNTRAPRSLGWGLLGLSAHGRKPAESQAWLTEAYEVLVKRRDPPYLLAMLVLAASDRAALHLLGIAAPAPGVEPAKP